MPSVFVYTSVTHFSPHCKQLTKALEPKCPALLTPFLEATVLLNHILLTFLQLQ